MLILFVLLVGFNVVVVMRMRMYACLYACMYVFMHVCMYACV